MRWRPWRTRRLNAFASTGFGCFRPVRNSTSSELAEQLGLNRVVESAAVAGAELLYLRRDLVDASRISAHVRELDIREGDEAARRSVLKNLAQADGWTSRVVIGFAYAGVLHIWTASAAWADDIDDLSQQQRGPRWLAPLGTSDSRREDASLRSNEEITGLAHELVAVPEFRRARLPERDAVARRVPASAALVERDSVQIFGLVREAGELLQQRVEECLARRRTGISDRRTVQARQKFAENRILDHTDQVRERDKPVRFRTPACSETKRCWRATVLEAWP